MADFSMFSPDGVNMLNVKDAPARNMVTDAFSPSTAYAVGDYCIYDGVLYICTTAHEGAWTAGDFAATTIANELKNVGGDLSSYQTKNLSSTVEVNGSNYSTVETLLGALAGASGQLQKYYGKVTNFDPNYVATTGYSNACSWAAIGSKDSPIYIAELTYWIYLKAAGSTRYGSVGLTKDLLPGPIFFKINPDGTADWGDLYNIFYMDSAFPRAYISLSKHSGGAGYLQLSAMPTSTTFISGSFTYLTKASDVKTYGTLINL